MRRVVYADIAEVIALLHDVVRQNDWEHVKADWEGTKILLACRGEGYVNANQEVFMQLRERPLFDILYLQIQRLRQSPEDIENKAKTILRCFAHYVRTTDFRTRDLRRAVGKHRLTVSVRPTHLFTRRRW